MNQASSGFSLCPQGEMLYAMFGNSINGATNMIESLNVRKLLNYEEVNWCAFHLASGEIYPRF